MKPSTGRPKVPEAKPGSQPTVKDDLKSIPMPEVEAQLESSPDGLTQADAQEQLMQYGPNEIEERNTNPLLKFQTYFWGPIPWMIEAAVVLSAMARHRPDFGIISLLLLANAVINAGINPGINADNDKKGSSPTIVQEVIHAPVSV
jgi:H+-transporting ATPase